MFYWIFLALTSAGPILPDQTTPIKLSWNNQGFTSRYTFSFWISSDIISDASLTIGFPSQYTSNLGLTSCLLYRITDQDPLQIPCSVSAKVLTIQISSIKAGLHKFQIENILNPSSSGSTGVFVIRTWQSGTVIDENALFPSIGIAPTPDSLSVTLSIQGTLLANYSPIYKFTILASSYYPVNSWMRILFPVSFAFEKLSCYVNEWNQWVSVDADLADSQIIFAMFSFGIHPVSLTFNVYGIYNPAVSGVPDNIIVEILRENTNTQHNL